MPHNNAGKGQGGATTPPPRRLKARRQVRGKLAQIKAYIDEQRGNDPDDNTGWRVLLEIFHDIGYIRVWPWTGRHTSHLSESYRQRRTASTYLLYYWIDETENAIYLIDLRHGSQKPLKPSTIKKYKGEIPPD